MPQGAAWEGLKHAAKSRIKSWLPGPYGKDVELPVEGKGVKEGYEQVKKLAAEPKKPIKEPSPQEIGSSIKKSLEQFKQRKR